MKKLVCVLFMVCALPLFGGLSTHSRRQAQAFNLVAEAGHTQVGGGYCDGPPCEHFPSTQSVTPAKGGKPALGRDGGVDLAAGVLVTLLALGLALRVWMK